MIDAKIMFSRREREIIALVAEGHSNKEVAAKLFISPFTVKSHLHNIFLKLKIDRRVKVAAYYFKKK